MELTAKEIEELELSVESMTKADRTDIASKGLNNWMSVQDIIKEANDILQDNPSLTLDDIDVNADYYHSYDDIFATVYLSYERVESKEEILEALKKNKLEEKQRDYDEYIRSLEIVRKYEEREGDSK